MSVIYLFWGFKHCSRLVKTQTTTKACFFMFAFLFLKIKKKNSSCGATRRLINWSEILKLNCSKIDIVFVAQKRFKISVSK
jgi:hypothetical protein